MQIEGVQGGEGVNEALRSLQKRLRADAIMVGLVEDGALCVAAAAGGAPAPGERLSLEETPWAAPLAGGSTSDAAAGVRGVPLCLDGERLGVLSVARATPLDAPEVEALRAAAERLGPTILAPRLLARLREERTAAEARLEEQAAGLYHDLINPIRHIQTLIAMLREDAPVLRGQPALYMDRIEESGHRAVAMIERMRRYARLPVAAGGAGPVDLAALILPRLARLDLAQAEAHVEGSLPVVWGDAEQIGLLVDELLDNALKFRAAGQKARIRVQARALPLEGAWATTIADEGIGFDMRFCDRILLPFRQLHPPHEYPGFGLGLAICERIVRRNQGRLDMHSEPDRGARFAFILPAPPTGS